jgi:hypothetical protein
MQTDAPNPEAPQNPEGKVSQTRGETEVVEQSVSAVATTSKRIVFKEIRRQLQETDLSSPGVQKMLLDELERAEAQCDVLEGYVDRYHQADKRAAVLEEKLRTQTALEIFFGVGLALGGAIIGLAPLFWDQTFKGPIALTIGMILVLGSAVGRIVKR